jgi:Ran GTPase-activating protein (RanGAP) involved in mRNA processing and transport
MDEISIYVEKGEMETLSKRLPQPLRKLSIKFDPKIKKLKMAQTLQQFLKINPNLQELDINHCVIEDEGLQIVLNGFQENENLKVLNISYCGITDKTVEMLIQFVEEKKSLSELNIGGNLWKAGIIEFGKYLKTNNHLKILNLNCLEKCKHLGQFFKELIGNETLTELIIFGNPLEKGIDSLCEFIQSNHSLLTLLINSCSMKFKEIEMLCESLKSNSCIQNINLSFNHVKDEGVNLFGNLLEFNKSIKSLKLASIEINVINPLFKSLKKNETLEILDISMNNIFIDNFEDYFEFNESLKHLELSNNNLLYFQKVDHSASKLLMASLMKNKGLKTLNLKGSRIHFSSFLEYISKTNTLETLHIPMINNSKMMFEALEKNNSITHLIYTKGDSFQTKGIENYIYKNKTLKIIEIDSLLELDFNSFGDSLMFNYEIQTVKYEKSTNERISNYLIRNKVCNEIKNSFCLFTSCGSFFNFNFIWD